MILFFNRVVAPHFSIVNSFKLGLFVSFSVRERGGVGSIYLNVSAKVFNSDQTTL